MIADAQEAVDKLEQQRREIVAKEETNTGWIQQFIQFQGITELTREVVVTLIDRIYVYEDKRIKIDFNYRNEIAYYQDLINQKSKEVS